MTQFLLIIRPHLLSALAALSLIGCSTISRYDQTAYANATSAKVEALTLLDKATGIYASHREDIEAVTITLKKGYEYDRGRSLNTDSIEMWESILLEKTDDPDSGTYTRFISLWKAQGKISAAAIPGKKTRLALAFDKLITLENGKIH